MQILGWEDLVCDCGRKEFSVIVNIKGHMTHGITKGPEIYQCTYCKRKLNTLIALTRIKQMAMQREIDQMKEELDSVIPRSSDEPQPQKV